MVSSCIRTQSLDFFLILILCVFVNGMALMLLFFIPNDIPLLPRLLYVFVFVRLAQASSFSPSGELKTSQPLDREEQDEHRFKVRAVDGGGRYCEADIHITVEDVNDNPPQFSSDPYTITVFENTETGTYVAKLLANDIDTGEKHSFAVTLQMYVALSECLSILVQNEFIFRL